MAKLFRIDRVKEMKRSKNGDRLFFDWIASQLGIKKQEDWYGISHVIVRRKSEDILNNYENCLSTALQRIYPEYEWYPWKFLRAPTGFWNNLQNEKRYFDWLSSELGIDSQEGWYGVSYDTISQNYGAQILKVHNHSHSKALQKAYPEYEWQEWHFATVPRGFWTSKYNRQKYFDWLATFSDSNWSMRARKWRSFSFKSMELSLSQQMVWTQLKKLFKNDEILLNYKHPGLIHSGSNKHMELDFYIPSIEVAVEYQGPQHFQTLRHWAPLKFQIQRDQEKSQMCKKLGITLIQIPFWWNTSLNSLLSHLQSHLSLHSPKVSSCNPN